MKDIGFAKYTTTDNTTVHALTDTPGVGMALPATDPWANGQRPNVAVMRADVHDINWRDNGESPSASVGITLTAGQTLEYTGELNRFRFCAVTSGSTLSVAYYYGQPGGEL